MAINLGDLYKATVCIILRPHVGQDLRRRVLWSSSVTFNLPHAVTL